MNEAADSTTGRVGSSDGRAPLQCGGGRQFEPGQPPGSDTFEGRLWTANVTDLVTSYYSVGELDSWPLATLVHIEVGTKALRKLRKMCLDKRQTAAHAPLGSVPVFEKTHLPDDDVWEVYTDGTRKRMAGIPYEEGSHGRQVSS